MKIRRLPEIDLARVAPLLTNQKRRELEHFKLGHPTINYKPVRTLFADIFNVQPDLFVAADPTPWPVLKRLIETRGRSDEERKANLLVAKGLNAFAQTNALRSRSHQFLPLSLSIGEKVVYWLPMVTVINEVPTILFIDPRRGKRLTSEARRFTFSMMHEHIRGANPDFSTSRLGILQFGSEIDGQRPAKLFTDVGIDLYNFDELDQMVRETYDIWREVSEAREEELHRKAEGGFGPLFETG